MASNERASTMEIPVSIAARWDNGEKSGHVTAMPLFIAASSDKQVESGGKQRGERHVRLRPAHLI